MSKNKVLITLLLGGICFFYLKGWAGEEPEKSARVSFLEGKARVSEDGGKTFRSVALGDYLSAGFFLVTEPDCRMELKLPDGSVLRVGGNSQMNLEFLAYDSQSETRDYRFKLGLGKIWAKTRDIAKKGSRFEVRTANAVTGVRGTVFRIDVESDQATIVKVYKGAILLRSPREVFRPGGKGREERKEIPPPREVAPPREISRAEWELLVKEMQEVYISPDGSASPPKGFSLKEDLNEWVIWNLERDRKESFPDEFPENTTR